MQVALPQIYLLALGRESKRGTNIRCTLFNNRESGQGIAQ